MTTPALYAELTAIFHTVFERSDFALAPHLTAADVPGWNSFRQIEIILAVEEHFNIRLDSDDVDQLENVGDLAAVIEAKTAGKGADLALG